MLMFKIYQSEHAIMSLSEIEEIIEWIVRCRLLVVEVIESYKLNSSSIVAEDKEREFLIQRGIIKPNRLNDKKEDQVAENKKNAE